MFRSQRLLTEIAPAAIKLGTNSGYYVFSYWDGKAWSQSYRENGIAFYPANELETASSRFCRLFYIKDIAALNEAPATHQ
jgi:hypothetical protein